MSDRVIDYEEIIRAHLARQPSAFWPGLRFTIPMREKEWWMFPRMPGWKYEYSFKLGADTQIRPFGPRYQITVQRRTDTAPCELRSVERGDGAALRRAFAEAFFGYTDYLYCTEIQLLQIGDTLLQEFFSRGQADLCRRASCLAIDPASGQVIGAALLAPADEEETQATEKATQFQPVFVIPAWRRRGVATALASEVLRQLWHAGQGILFSGCSIYNSASKQWHQAFGVTEIQHFFARIPIFRWLRNEIFRKRYLLKTYGTEFDPAEIQKLERCLICLADELDALRELGDNHNYRSEADRILG